MSLSKDIFSILGKYLTFEEAFELKKEFVEAEKIGIYKNYVIIKDFTSEKLDLIYQINPGIKSLEIKNPKGYQEL
jgi:hypothetical protein